MSFNSIISTLPYTYPFLFVDEILQIDEESCTGTYRFPNDSYFYKGHFKDNPVTPGVILTECMAQIGVVCLGSFLLNITNQENPALTENIQIALSSSQIDFFIPVYPGEQIKVVSKKEYFRFNKLKCGVEMFNSNNELVCRGTIAGMIRK
ncbi:3-hydroxyacyl-[acyl-carrier-protein] dehydratase [Gillisia mitskevichiae]|uniref:3-hydroxyacyl-[acyl-carrier-protein] dehydratase n=1 Tax=Gillisia mitskevichiae TaxID=270921 RepID=A0A495PU67_9FLAO|nr:hydroxymyristoyl-ACP dehydratase [Gillisia mitskevichiae]RKS53102.1 3-hydroxyacyl-[acyl-carrier-protein] dehydratase [Gillisia mitskevichiae]